MTHPVNAGHSFSQAIELTNLSSASASRADVAAFETTLPPASGSLGAEPSSGGALTNHQNQSTETLSNLYDLYSAGSHGPAMHNSPSPLSHSSLSSLGLPNQRHGLVTRTPHTDAQTGTAENNPQTSPHFAANHSDAEMGIGSGLPAHTSAQTETTGSGHANAGNSQAAQPETQQAAAPANWFQRNYTRGDRFDKATKPFQVPLAAGGILTAIAIGAVNLSKKGG